METMAEERRFIVSVSGGHRVTVIDSSDSSSSSPLFVYAPGAGSSLDDPFGRWLAQELSSEGIHLWRLQFPYMEAKRKAPDRAPVLEATWRAVASEAGPKAVFGGRSMGGRIALRSLQTERQPSGWPSSRIRSTRLAGRIACATSISAQSKFPPSKVPTLFCSGTRDAFASSVELETAGSLLEAASLPFIAGADHGFNVPKSSGLTQEDVWKEALSILVPFVKSVSTN